MAKAEQDNAPGDTYSAQERAGGGSAVVNDRTGEQEGASVHSRAVAEALAKG